MRMISRLKKLMIAKGQVYNLGGGPENVMSIWAEFRPKLEKLIGENHRSGARRLASR